MAHQLLIRADAVEGGVCSDTIEVNGWTSMPHRLGNVVQICMKEQRAFSQLRMERVIIFRQGTQLEF